MKTRLFIIAFIFAISSTLSNKSKAQNASFNYNTSTGTVGTTYSWIDCSSGTEISFSNDDDGHASVSWPFNFSFYDDNYTSSNSLSVSTNGFIRLDGTASDDFTDAGNYNLTSSATSFGQIVCLGINDCNTDQTRTHVYYNTTGSSPNRIFTIEYVDLEINYNASEYVDIEVQFYETSNKIVILMGADDVTQTSADIGIHSGVSSYFNKWQDVDDGTNNAWIEYSHPKTLTSITYNQASSSDITINQSNVEILRMDFKVSGGTGTLNLNSIKITADNDADADIASSGVKLYRTTTTTFSTANQLGTSQSLSSSSATFSSLSYDLPGGTTYIWAVYDISNSATNNNDVDISIATNDINVAGTTYPSSSQDPAGERTITFIEWDGSSSSDWTVGANWSGGSVPGNSDDIVIPSGTPNDPQINDGDIGKCASITIKSGATLTIDLEGKIKIHGDLINNGTIDNSNGTKMQYLFGDGGINYIKGSGTFTHFRMRIDGGTYYNECNLTNLDRFVIENDGIFYLGNHTMIIKANSLLIKTANSKLYMEDGTIELQSGFPNSTGQLICGTNSTFYYNSSSNQTIPGKYDYYNLKIGNSGTKKINDNIDIIGDLTIESGAELNQNSYAINLAGDWNNSGTFTQGTQTVTLNGSSAQTIGGSTATTFYNLTANNSSGGITLNKTVNVSNTLTLTSGIINTSSSNLLIFGSSATAFSGGSNSSYIDGPVRKDGSGDFIFPTGDGGKYARIGIASLSASDNFTAEYHKAKPSDNENYDSPITKVSDNEYWDLNRSSATASVTMYWEDSKWSGIGSFSELRIMRYGTKWVAESGTYSNSGSADLDNPVSGSLSVTGVSNFGAFSFGTTHNLHNTLPVSLIEFNTTAKENSVVLDWKTASEENNDYFIIERSQNGIDIEQIGIVNGSGNSNEILSYSYIDNSPLKDISYYRLTQVDFDGESKSYEWEMVSFVKKNQIEMFLYPNPISNNNLNIDAHNIFGQTQIRIFDNSNRLVFEKAVIINSENQTINLQIDFPKGIYFVQLINSEKLITKKLIVN
jgi:hypothetical protein